MPLRHAAKAILVSIVGFVATVVHAGGPLGINAACAATGCFAGDAPGLPVTISTEGSYLLTGNLVQTDPNLDVIQIQTSLVWLDLSGFHISGSCSGGPPCAPQGSGAGIHGDNDADHVTVLNGTLRQLAGIGIHLPGAEQRVEHVAVHANGANGATLGSGTVRESSFLRNGAVGLGFVEDGMIFDCEARLNHLTGFMVGVGGLVAGNVSSQNRTGILLGSAGVIYDNQLVDNIVEGLALDGAAVVVSNVARENGTSGILLNTVAAVLVRNISHGNGLDGIQAVDGSLLADNLANGNGRDGIRTGAQSLVVRNVTYGNTEDGVFADAGSLVRGNTSRENGGDGIFANDASNVSNNATSENKGHGVSVNGRSRVLGNTSRDNTRVGLRMQDNTGFEENVSSGNGDGETLLGVSMGTNLCGTNVTCP